MVNRFQHETLGARVNIKLDLHTGGEQKRVELPFKLLVIGDYSNGQENRPIAEREKIAIDKNNFNAVMAKLNPNVTLTVKNTFVQDDSSIDISLSFKNIKDFEPESVAKQIPALRSLLAMRNLLRDLKSNLLDNATFRLELEQILKDARRSDHLRTELTAIETRTIEPQR